MTTFYDDFLQQRTEKLKAGGNYRTFLTLRKSAATFPVIEFLSTDGCAHSAVNWCSNDYMNMSVSDLVIQTSQQILSESGLGSGGTRNISGTSIYHRSLEETLARLHQKESALLFNSAFLANQTTLATLGSAFEHCVFLSDERNHASMIAGMKASKRPRLIFKHNRPEHLREILSALPKEQPKIIACESVYSMTGSIAPLQSFAELARTYNALLYVDEVHAVGIYGTLGEGLAAEQHCADGIHILNGTLAKSFGTLGGYIVAGHSIIEFVRSFAPGFIFTTSLPPAICAAAQASIEFLMQRQELRLRYHNHVALFREVLSLHGVRFINTPSHITPIVIGDTERCKQHSTRLLHDYGVYVQPINYPTVPRGEECLRLTITLRHTKEQMHHLAESLTSVIAHTA